MASVNPFTSIVMNSLSVATAVKSINITASDLKDNQFFYIKDASQDPAIAYIDVYPISCVINDSPSVLYVKSTQSLLLHKITNDRLDVLGAYTPNDPYAFSTTQLPVESVAVNPPMTTSQLFVDLRTESKTIVLPPISEIPGLYGEVLPYYSIKDVYGNAGLSSLFLSTSGNAILDRLLINNGTKLNSNFAAIDLTANLSTNRWQILNYFNGEVSTSAGLELPPSSVYISSPISYVNNSETHKVIMLPTASTVLQGVFTIKNPFADGVVSTILVSTQMNDFMENNLSTLVLGFPFESIRLTAPSSTRYSVTSRYIQGLTPFGPP